MNHDICAKLNTVRTTNAMKEQCDNSEITVAENNNVIQVISVQQQTND